jgi:hypothetical protein
MPKREVIIWVNIKYMAGYHEVIKKMRDAGKDTFNFQQYRRMEKADPSIFMKWSHV